MEAIEFIAKIKDRTITIPKKYLNKLTPEFRVIILMNNTQEPAKITKKSFSAFGITTKDLHFDRDEANER